MKKKVIIALAVLAVFCVALCGCTKEPPDLSGTWKQVNSNSDEVWQEATIDSSAGTITIYYVMNSGDTRTLYWAGTFTAPTNADEPYKWTSTKDAAQTDKSLLGSQDATKDFTYENNQIVYNSSLMGVDSTNRLEKQQ